MGAFNCFLQTEPVHGYYKRFYLVAKPRRGLKQLKYTIQVYSKLINYYRFLITRIFHVNIYWLPHKGVLRKAD